MDAPAQMIRGKLATGLLPRQEATKTRHRRPVRGVRLGDLPQRS